ncbi:hypothetical protein V8C35DRAFT_319140 [Trichoderma chlorosporum]
MQPLFEIMDNISEDRVYYTDPTYLEDKALTSIYIWLPTNLKNLLWQNGPIGLARCISPALLDYTRPIQQEYHNAMIFRMLPNSSTTTSMTGDLLPLYPFSGASVSGASDEEATYELKYGKKLHLPAKSKAKQRTIHVWGTETLYFLWLSRPEDIGEPRQLT